MVNIILFGLVGVLFIIFGYMIKVKRKGSLINFYNESKYKDNEKYLDWIGTTELLSGIILLSIGFISLFIENNNFIISAFVVTIIATIISLVFGELIYRK